MKSCFLSTARVGRADWNFFFHNFGKNVFLKKKSVHSGKKKNVISKKKKISDWPLFLPPGGQETIIHLRMALGLVFPPSSIL